LAKGIAKSPKGASFACYDMLMTIAPAMLLTVISLIFNITIVIMGVSGYIDTDTMIQASGSAIFFCLFIYTLYMFMYGALTTFTEWNQIHSTSRKKIMYLFTFPLFMITYIPIGLVALFKRCEWKPIQHSISVDVTQFGQAAEEANRI
jgi:hypothetical protein